jgi:filamentous hemagglutinin family protein
MHAKSLIAGQFQVLALLAALFATSFTAHAGSVTLDGSLGHAAGPVTSNNGLYVLTRASGKQVGNNLFFSLGQFNLDKGETAQFSGPNSVTNVLTRVTGGTSAIDGTIQCTIPNASFYLINTAGVLFGPDAALDVQGSFAVTTADEVKLADGKKFAAPGPADATLTSAAPAAFGFLSSKPAGIVVDGIAPTTGGGGNTHYHPSLNPAPNGTLTVVGGDIVVSGGELATAGAGAATIVSVASPGTVSLSNPTDVSSFSSLADVVVEMGGLLGSDAYSHGGVDSGTVSVVAGNVDVTGTDAYDSYLSMLGSFSGSGRAGAVSVDVSGAVTVNGGAELGSDATFGVVSGSTSGSVTVTAQTVSVTGTDAYDTNVSSLASFSGTGNSGPVTITAGGAINVTGGGEVGSDATVNSGAHSGSVTVAAGSILVSGADTTGQFPSSIGSFSGTSNAGAVSIAVAGDLTISKGAEIGSDATDVDGNNLFTESGAVFVTAGTVTVEDPGSSLGSFTGGGNGGDVTLTAQSLSVSHGGEVSAGTLGAGNGGNVQVTVTGPVTLDGSTSSFPAGILSNSNQSAPGGGKGGDITVKAETLTVSDGAEISAGTFGAGNAGNVHVTVTGPVALDGSIANFPAGILSNSNQSAPGSGNGGDVTLTAQSLSVSHGGEVSAGTFGAGNAGNVHVTVTGPVTLDGSTPNFPAGILSNSNQSAPGGGKGGDVTLTAQSLSVSHGGEVSAGTFGAGNGGNIQVTVTGPVTLDGSISNFPAGILSNSNQSTPGGGKGGDVTLTAQSLSVSHGGEVSAGTFGTGNGGNIHVTVIGPVTLDGATSDFPSGILSNSSQSTPGGGKGADVTVKAETLTVSNGAQVSASTFGTGAGGSIHVTAAGAIDLAGASPFGSSGIFSASQFTAPGGGSGGEITIHAGMLTIQNGAVISATTVGTGAGNDIHVDVSGPVLLAGAAATKLSGIFANSLLTAPGGGGAGDVTVNAAELSITDQAAIGAASRGTGAAGSIDCSLSGSLFLESGGAITVSALQSHGGNISISSGGNVVIDDGGISAQAIELGNIYIATAPDSIVLVLGSTITAQASTLGGQIIIDPALVVVGQHSTIDGLAGDHNLIVEISADALVVSPDSRILADRAAFSVNTNVTAGLVALPASVFGGNIALIPGCATMVGGDASSFVQTGNGGLPPEPGGWLPELNLVRNDTAEVPRR